MEKKEIKKVIGFVVEGVSDANFIQFLVDEYFENKFKSTIITTSGSAAMTSSIRIIVSSLLNNGVDYVFVVFDVDELPVENHLKYLNKELKKQGINDSVSLIPVNRFLETWLLYGYLDDISNIPDMSKKEQLDKLKYFGHIKKAVKFELKDIDFSKMMRNKDFKRFIEEIEKVA